MTRTQLRRLEKLEAKVPTPAPDLSWATDLELKLAQFYAFECLRAGNSEAQSEFKARYPRTFARFAEKLPPTDRKMGVQERSRARKLAGSLLGTTPAMSREDLPPPESPIRPLASAT